MGGSGCGKSTLLKHLIGLLKPAAGEVRYGETDFWAAKDVDRERLMQEIGILYQQGALWSSLTLAENIVVPLKEYTNLNDKEIREFCAFKLKLVGLAGFDDYYPSENTEKLKELQGVLTDTLREAEGMFAQDSPLRYHLAALLHRYTKVASKLEVLLDTMETNPESILTGKPE